MGPLKSSYHLFCGFIRVLVLIMVYINNFGIKVFGKIFNPSYENFQRTDQNKIHALFDGNLRYLHLLHLNRLSLDLNPTL
jgi:hypothetical protein